MTQEENLNIKGKCITITTPPWTNQSEQHSVSIYLKSNVFWSINQHSFTLRICLFYTFSFKMHDADKKV